MGLSAFNAMRARLKREQAEAEKTSTPTVIEVKEAEPVKEPVAEPVAEVAEKKVTKKTDAEKLKGKKE